MDIFLINRNGKGKISITRSLNQQMPTFYLLYNTIFYSKISPTCFGYLFWDHHQGPVP
jgi:hypothetical protein